MIIFETMAGAIYNTEFEQIMLNGCDDNFNLLIVVCIIFIVTAAHTQQKMTYYFSRFYF